MGNPSIQDGKALIPVIAAAMSIISPGTPVLKCICLAMDIVQRRYSIPVLVAPRAGMARRTLMPTHGKHIVLAVEMSHNFYNSLSTSMSSIEYRANNRIGCPNDLLDLLPDGTNIGLSLMVM